FSLFSTSPIFLLVRFLLSISIILVFIFLCFSWTALVSDTAASCFSYYCFPTFLLSGSGVLSEHLYSFFPKES
ncbi:hypothetical protein HDV64DRAFT_247544, partial [Trichoderma sp. TUCIM 5745]